MDNEGEIIWYKTYLHPQFEDRDHRITDIEILENGDVLCLGGISKPGEKSEIWLFKVNGNGCFGDDHCDDDLIYTFTEEYSVQNEILIYPNPTSGVIHVNYISDLDSYTLMDINGKVILRNKNIAESIDLSFLNQGMYLISIKDKTGKSIISKVIITK